MALGMVPQNKVGIVLPGFDLLYNSRYPLGNKPNDPVNENGIFIAPGGVDSAGRRGIGEPYATYAYAAAQNASDLDFIWRGGTYTEQAVANSRTGLHIHRSGIDSDNMLSLRGYPGETVIIEGGGRDMGMLGQATNDVKIQDFEMRNFVGDGLAFAGGCDNIQVSDMYIHTINGTAGSNVSGVQFNQTTNATLSNSKVHDIGIDGAFTNQNCACVQSYQMDQVDIHTCTFYNSRRALYHKQAVASMVGVNFFRNHCYNVRESVFLGIAGNNDPAHLNSKFYQNLMIVDYYGLDCSEEQTIPEHNNIQFFNNTVIANAAATPGGAIYLERLLNLVMFNNIFSGAFSVGTLAYVNDTFSATEIDYNTYFNSERWETERYLNSTVYTSLASWTAGTGFDANSNTNNPQFVDALNGDYRLLTGSPSLTSGRVENSIGNTTGYAGCFGPDIIQIGCDF